MKIFRFDATEGEKIDRFENDFIFSRIARIEAEASINCFQLGTNGIVGYHQAVAPQLFLVVRGEGWVRNETSWKIPVVMGHAVFWENDEWHEAGTNTGLMAIVIEGKFVNPSEVMSMKRDSPNHMPDSRIDERIRLLCNR
jgi:quercetin dioxygenase-like cupin family protein